jgi:hypothetical protein
MAQYRFLIGKILLFAGKYFLSDNKHYTFDVVQLLNLLFYFKNRYGNNIK